MVDDVVAEPALVLVRVAEPAVVLDVVADPAVVLEDDADPAAVLEDVEKVDEPATPVEVADPTTVVVAEL